MSKRSAPPPRPPAPRSGGGMSFSFKALEEGDDEDEELTVLEGKFDKQVSIEKEKIAKEMDREREYSKSPTERSLSSNEEKPLTRSQNSFEKIKDFTGKIQETITKKIEELSDSPPKSEPIPIKAEKELNGEFGGSFEAGDTKSLELSNDTDTNSLVDNETQYFELSTDSDKFKDPGLNDADDLNMVDEYYNPEENDENFSDLPGVVPVVRQRKKFPFMKSKPVVPPTPISMSRLSKDLKEVDSVENANGKIEGLVNKSNNNDDNVSKITKDLAIIAKEHVNRVVNIGGKHIPVWKILGALSLLFLYVMLPLPSYMNGMIMGLFLSSTGWSLYLWIKKPRMPREAIPDLPLDKLPPMPVPEMKEPKGEDGCYKVSCTQITVFLVYDRV